MILFVNGKQATLKSGSSFEYISENRSFSDADDYTLSITLPITDCQSNIEIFGHLTRKDVGTKSSVFDAEIRDRAFSKFGVLTVVGVDGPNIKCQFLEGRSHQNFDETFDNVYINTLDLGSFPSIANLQSPAAYLKSIDDGAQYVALPWVNESADYVINNEIKVSDGKYIWAKSLSDMGGGLSFQPYLLSIAKKICSAVGYSYDFSSWEKSYDRHLLVCNCLPSAWDIRSIARALPKWSVTEFFEEVEKLLCCEIDIDHKGKTVSMKYSNEVEAVKTTIQLTSVVDDFTAEVSYEDSIAKYKGLANVRYRQCSYARWKYDQCQWLIDLMRKENKYVREFEDFAAFNSWSMSKWGMLTITGKDAERGADMGSLIYCRKEDAYFIARVYYGNMTEYPNMYFWDWMRINRFGDLIVDKDSDNEIELSIVPVCIDETDSEHGSCMFLNFSSFAESEEYDESGIRQPLAMSALLNGDEGQNPDYYDCIYTAYWTGVPDTAYAPPCPLTAVGGFLLGNIFKYSLELKDRYKNYQDGVRINGREKHTFKFLSDTIPNVRSIFNIQGKLYLCEKITATFTEDGMSQLLKGDFYPIIDD